MDIGKQCAGRRSDNRRVQVLASNALAEDMTIEGHGYWQAMHWRKI